MVTGIIGRKVGMTQLFQQDGSVGGATVTHASGPIPGHPSTESSAPT